MNGGLAEAGGCLPSNEFGADLEVRFGIDLAARIEPQFLAFLDDNPFMAFKSIATRQNMRDHVQFRASATLGAQSHMPIAVTPSRPQIMSVPEPGNMVPL
jgi:hypothetical protein